MRIQIKKFVFYFAWTVYLFNYIIFEQSQFQDFIGSYTLTKGIKLTALILLLISIFYRREIKKKVFKLSCIIAAIFLIAFFTADSLTVLFWGLFSLAAIDNINYRDFLKYDIKLRVTLYNFIFLCAITGVLKNDIHMVYGNEKVTLGYVHYNMFGMNVAVLITELIAMYRESDNKLKMYFFILLLYVLQLSVGVGRTGLYASMIILCFSILLENVRFKSFVIRHTRFFCLSPIILAIASFVLSYNYDSSNRFMRTLNYLSSTRLAFSKQFLDSYKLSAFGQKLYINNDASLGQYSALDMGYIRVGLEYGLLMLILLIIAFYFMQKKSLKSEAIGLYLAELYFCLALLAATSVINVANNWLLIFSVQVFVGNRAFLREEVDGGSNQDENRLMHTIQS